MSRQVYSVDTPRDEIEQALDGVVKEMRASPKPVIGLITYYMYLLQIRDRIDHRNKQEKKHASRPT